MELKEGMYVRTKTGMISKIISKEDVSGSLHREEIVFILDNGNRLALHSRKLVKASYNIIDLIEVGDYVNGYKVVEIIKDFKVIVDKSELNTNDGNYYLKSFTNNQIKDIVTKEQFEVMKYIIKK